MPTNNFKLFDENKANLLTDTEYVNSTQRLNGVQTGVASSQLNNKFAYQVSLVAYSIAQLMNANGLDASDTLAVSAFVGNLQGAILQKVADKATSAEAAAGVLSNKYITPETMKAAALLLSGGVMNGVLDMGNNRITNLGTPTADSDAVTKEYVDGRPSKILSESITINENFTGSKISIEELLTQDIDLNEVDAIGIRMTFNEDYVLRNTSSNRNYGLSISYRDATFFNVVPLTSSTYTIANAGQSIFIPILLYPQIFNSSSAPYGGISDSINIFTLPSLAFSSSNNAILSKRIKRNSNNRIDISIGNSSYNTTTGQNITFDIYKIYF